MSLLSSTSCPQLGSKELKRRNWTLRLVPRRMLAFWKSVHFGWVVGAMFPGGSKAEEHSECGHLFLGGRCPRRKKGTGSVSTGCVLNQRAQ